MSNGWDEVDNIKVDAKNDILMQAFEYAYQHKVDTVELEVEFTTGQAIKAKVTFELPDLEKDEENEDGSNN